MEGRGGERAHAREHTCVRECGFEAGRVNKVTWPLDGRRTWKSSMPRTLKTKKMNMVSITTFISGSNASSIVLMIAFMPGTLPRVRRGRKTRNVRNMVKFAKSGMRSGMTPTITMKKSSQFQGSW